MSKTGSDKLLVYINKLRAEEKSKATCEKYEHDIRTFLRFMDRNTITKELVIAYKERLKLEYKPSSVNSMLAAINGFLSFAGYGDCRVKQVKTQRKIFCLESQELSIAEYRRLVEAARQNGNERIGLILQAICATGIRVSELEFITIEAIREGTAVVRLKGKVRTVFIPEKLKKQLLKYASKNKLIRGQVFVTKSGKPVDRSNIWRDMKKLCRTANVNPDKVFPHNLRHLFARTYYDLEKDIAKLADILGHSNIETTRLYIISTGSEHSRQISSLGLVV